MPTQGIPADEICQRGEEIYQSRLRSRFDTPENRGKLLVIDIETGNGEVETDGTEAAKRLIERNPGAELYFMRIGHDTAFELFGCGALIHR